MKRLLLPIALITFSILCLSIVHIDNINKLDNYSDTLREKHKTVYSKSQADHHTIVVQEIKNVKK